MLSIKRQENTYHKQTTLLTWHHCPNNAVLLALSWLVVSLFPGLPQFVCSTLISGESYICGFLTLVGWHSRISSFSVVTPTLPRIPGLQLLPHLGSMEHSGGRILCRRCATTQPSYRDLAWMLPYCHHYWPFFLRKKKQLLAGLIKDILEFLNSLALSSLHVLKYFVSGVLGGIGNQLSFVLELPLPCHRSDC